MLWRKVAGIFVGVVCSGGTLQAADCNANGVDDTLDLAAGDLEMAPEHVWAQVRSPRAIVSGDWNSDGSVDVATANAGSFNISIFLNQGDGSLKEPLHYDVGGGPGSLLGSDLNDDGKLDLVAGTSNGIFVLLGRGDGTFAKAIAYEAEVSVSVLMAAELSGDGKTDLAVGTPLEVFVLPGRGDGTFEDAMSYDVGEVHSLIASDLNRDGLDDLAVGTRLEVVVLLGRGDGTFKEWVVEVGEEEMTGRVSSLVPADLNGDDKPDLAVAGRFCRDCETSDVLVLLNRGDGTLEEPVPYRSELEHVATLLASDLNGDGNTDLAAAGHAGRGSQVVVVLLGSGDGSLKPADRYELAGSAHYSVHSLIASDLDGDARPELIAGGEICGVEACRQVFVLPGRGDGTFENAVPYSADYGDFSLLALDLNGDGTTDLVGAGDNGTEISYYCGVFVLLGRGDGTFEDRVLHEMGDSTFLPLVTSDFDGDGKEDLAVGRTLWDATGTVSGVVLVLRGRDDATFEKPQSYSIGSLPAWSLVASDFNGDGKKDLAAGAASTVSILRGRGDGTFEEAESHKTGANPSLFALTLLLAYDLNDDGRPDLAAGTTTGVAVALAHSDGAFAPAVHYELGGRASSLLVSDFNADETPDLVVGTSFSVAVLVGESDGTFEEAVHYSVGDPISHLVATDLNADGDTDFAAGTPHGLLVLLGGGDGDFGEAVGYGTGMNVSSLAAADLDGDGETDLAVGGQACENDCVGRVGIFPGRGDGTFKGMVPHDVGPATIRSLLASDFDGEQSTDLAVVTPGGIWVLTNHTRAPVSLDLDGDGIPDECSGVPFLRGDFNTNDHAGFGDATRLLNFLFAQGGAPSCEKAADVNDSGRINVSDAVYILMYLFAGGPAPPAPFGECGLDPTPDDLGCEMVLRCP